MKRTKELDRKVCKLYQQGMTIYEIQDAVGICTYTVLNILNEYSIPRHKRTNRTQEVVIKNRQYIEAELSKGVEPTTIALSLMVSPNLFNIELNRLGIRPIVHASSVYDPHYRDIKQMRKDGYSLTQIASTIGGNASGVAAYCSRMLIPCDD